MSSDSTLKTQVLVVEDEPDFAALMESILVKAGYGVATAFSCDDARARVRETKPDLITLDIKMPGKSGALLYRALKADEASRDIPVVVVTGLTRDDRDMENIIRTLLEPEHVPHPAAYLEKPLDESRLLSTVREVLPSVERGP